MTKGKTIAATAAAVAVAAGTYFAVTSSGPDDSIYVPDIYVPEIPIVDIATVDVYVPTIPVIEINEVTIQKEDIASIDPTPYLQKSIDVPSVPYYDTYVSSYESNIPYYSGIKAQSAEKVSNIINPFEIRSTNIKTVNVKDYNSSIQENVSFYKRIKDLFRDKKTLFSDKNINKDNVLFKQWVAAFEKYQKYELSFKPINDNFKIIAEVHYPIDPDILNTNLEFYSSKGYNGVLVTFGYEDESLPGLMDIVSLIKSKNMKVFISYSGPENDTHSLFSNINVLSDKLKVLAKESDGLLLGWRRTSLHMYTQDNGFTNFIMAMARSVNPNILIIGEAFYGETKSKTGSLRNLEYNIPKNSSGVLIVGFGYSRIAVESVLNNLLTDIKDCNKLALILGDMPYYNTRFNTSKSFKYNFEIKEELAKRWIKAGCRGVIVLHGDGSDGMYDKKYTDNLGNTLY